MVESAQNSWDKHAQPFIGNKGRSQSISNEQWNQVVALQGSHPHGPATFNNNSSTELATFSPSKQTLASLSTVGGRTSAPHSRGMVSSSSVSDINAVAPQNHHHVPAYPTNMTSVNTFVF